MQFKFGKYTKAIVAVVMALISAINLFAGTDIAISENIVATIVGAVVSIAGPYFIYKLPNTDNGTDE